MKTKYIVGGVIIISFIIWAGISFNKTLTPYVSISEAKSTESVVQVKGQRLDTGRFDLKTNEFIFTMIDEKGEKIEVVYGGAKPGNFDQATEIVCIGQYKSGQFHAKELLVKCPSKYMEEGIKV
ncbi:MAG: cytochrome c maturation protein CcmE [Calditrichia bacterium]|nr:cytochrome c maturation protein CcmE [Calditrichia bacterium]